MVIVGVGLVGGSLALAARERGLAAEIVGVGRSAENLDKALALKVIDRHTFRMDEALEGADLVVLAVPVGSLLRLAEEMAPHLAPGTIVTDVGSVKGDCVARIEGVMPPGVHFVGGHPIAGREKAGVEAATANLFAEARCILTPTARTPEEPLRAIQTLWEAVGARVSRMDPETHDRIFAAVSHLPHVIAYALVNTLLALEEEDAGVIGYAAGGFRDFTRIAGSHPEMWRDICLLNREPLLRMIGRYQEVLGRLKDAIEREDGETLLVEFARAREVREKL
ncbi:MAG: prephenate dehydrogenase/arogenate dehydrogenase family protein [Nitrospirae bacterium]|nr:prephenate dehydrogenase/arogenate dehydrogenase family protein [Nitrospirota bacterium]